MAGDLLFVVGILWNWGRTREKNMIADHNSDIGFTAYDSIHGIKINTQKQIASFFHENHSIIFQRSLRGYI